MFHLLRVLLEHQTEKDEKGKENKGRLTIQGKSKKEKANKENEDIYTHD